MAAKTTIKRFKMDTRSFVTIWRNHINHNDSNEWRKFVLAVFARFTGGSEHGNQLMLQGEDKNWKKWTDDQRYEFLSEKCYLKAINIRKELRDLEPPVEVQLPNGYKSRKGSKAARITYEEVANIFKGS